MAQLRDVLLSLSVGIQLRVTMVITGGHSAWSLGLWGSSLMPLELWRLQVAMAHGLGWHSSLSPESGRSLA